MITATTGPSISLPGARAVITSGRSPTAVTSAVIGIGVGPGKNRMVGEAGAQHAGWGGKVVTLTVTEKVEHDLAR